MPLPLSPSWLNCPIMLMVTTISLSLLSISTKVPTVFKTRFSGFNCPEKHKHKKQTLSNLAEQKLEKYTIQIRELIQGQQYLNEMALG